MGWRDLIGLKPTIERFAGDLLRGMTRTDTGAWHFDATAQALKRNDGAVFNLVNAFMQYDAAAAGDRAAIFDRHLAMLNAIDNSPPRLWSLARKNVFPLLRSRYDGLAIDIAARAGGKVVPRLGRRWHGDLSMRIGYDFGSFTSQVTEPELDTWGVTEDELFEVALGNLRAHPKPHWERIDDGLWQLQAEADFPESHLLLGTTVVATLPAPGDAIVMATNRGVVLATGADTPDGVMKLLRTARTNLLEVPWPLEPVLLRAADGALTPCTPEGDAARALQALRQIDRASLYAGQKEALDQYNEQAGIDLFVATCSLYGDKDDPDMLNTWCSWAQGVVSLLPVTDFIALGQEEVAGHRATAWVAWDEVSRLCGHYLQRTDEDPARYRVDAFPNEEEWLALLQVAESSS